MMKIIDYISFELFAPDAANKLLYKLENRIMSLSEFPERHQLIEEEFWRDKGIRKIVVNNYFVYYWINTLDKIVHVIAVIYAKRDQLDQLASIDINE